MTDYPGGLVLDTSRIYYFTMPSSQSSCISYPSGVTIYSGCSDTCLLTGQKKRSQDQLDYTVDFSKAFDNTGDTIKSFTASINSPQSDGYDIVIVWSMSTTTQVTFMLLSGHSGVTEEISISVVTTQGRQFDCTLGVPINSCAPSYNPVSGAFLETNNIAITAGDQFLDSL